MRRALASHSTPATVGARARESELACLLGYLMKLSPRPLLLALVEPRPEPSHCSCSCYCQLAGFLSSLAHAARQRPCCRTRVVRRRLVLRHGAFNKGKGTRNQNHQEPQNQSHLKWQGGRRALPTPSTLFSPALSPLCTHSVARRAAPNFTISAASEGDDLDKSLLRVHTPEMPDQSPAAIMEPSVENDRAPTLLPSVS
jgi:hypothetical protein